MKRFFLNVLPKLAVLTLVITAALGTSYLYANWSAPTASPPADNVDAPLNTGPITQIKDAGLNLLSLIVNGPIRVINGSLRFDLNGVTEEKGQVLMSTDSLGNVTWVATSSLGITGSGSGSGSGGGSGWCGASGRSTNGANISVDCMGNTLPAYSFDVSDPFYTDGGTQGSCPAGFTYVVVGADGNYIGTCVTDSGGSGGSFSCPAGFTRIESSAGVALGCIQNDEEGTNSFFAASNVCLSKYGGRLPSHGEWYLGASNYALSNEVGNYEWLDDLKTETVGMAAGETSIEDTDSPWLTDTTVGYRCFIPASGGGGGGSGGGSLEFSSIYTATAPSGGPAVVTTSIGASSEWDSCYLTQASSYGGVADTEDEDFDCQVRNTGSEWQVKAEVATGQGVDVQCSAQCVRGGSGSGSGGSCLAASFDASGNRLGGSSAITSSPVTTGHYQFAHNLGVSANQYRVFAQTDSPLFDSTSQYDAVTSQVYRKEVDAFRIRFQDVNDAATHRDTAHSVMICPGDSIGGGSGSGSGGGSFSCPAGFTLIENNGYALGCMQNDEEGVGTYYQAANTCRDNFGGRPPSWSEWYISMNEYALANETDDHEWLDDLKDDGVGMTAGNGSITTTRSPGLTNSGISYRCFIPASGGGGGGASLPSCSADQVVVYDGSSWQCTDASSVGGGSSLPSCSTDDVIVYDGSAWQCRDVSTISGSSGSMSFDNFLHMQDRKAAGTHGGSVTAGVWLTRDLTWDDNNISGASRSGNRFTLPAGTYYIEASAPVYGVDRNIAKLRNISSGSDVLIGTAERSDASDPSITESEISGTFTISSTRTFEIQHRTERSQSTWGFGYAPNYGVTNIFTDVKIWKIN